MIGGLWYGLIFSGLWKSLSGVGMSAGPYPPYYPFIVSFLTGLVLAYVTAIALQDSDNPNMARHGMQFGIFFGIGIWASQLFNVFTYEQKPIGLYLIDAGYVIVGMTIMGAIIGAWRKRA